MPCSLFYPVLFTRRSPIPLAQMPPRQAPSEAGTRTESRALAQGNRRYHATQTEPHPSVSLGQKSPTTHPTSFHRQACDELPAGMQPQLHPFVAAAVPTDTTLKTRVRYPGTAATVSEVSGVVNTQCFRLFGACS